VPIYIHFIGIEAYGLMGVFATLLGIFGLLDMGLSSTLNREIAKLSVQNDKAQNIRDLVRTLEIPYWFVGILIGLVMVLSSPLIAHHWVRVKTISSHSVQTSIMLMGLCAAFQWPISFYSGGLMGLQRQVLLNAINTSLITFRGLGAVLILWLISPTVEAFFLWQAAVSALQVGLIVFFLWGSLPPATGAARFRLELVQDIWRFAAGMTGLTITATILLQVDKIILSHMLNLKQFGYYSLASIVAMALYRILSPIFESIYPQFTKLVESGDIKNLIKLYHQSAQLVSVLIFSTALIVGFFSKEILIIWTRNTITANNTYIIVNILIASAAINCVVHIPYALQLAYGWTRLAIIVDVISVLVLIPLMILFTRWYGVFGAASIGVLLNLGYIFISVPIMYRRFLSSEKWKWYFQDIGQPLVAASVVVIMGRYIIKPDWPPMRIVFGLGVLSLGTLLAAACAANQLDIIARFKLLLNTK
jgi:O-antigen/teichoic acid export membrane protein